MHLKYLGNCGLNSPKLNLNPESKPGILSVHCLVFLGFSQSLLAFYTTNSVGQWNILPPSIFSKININACKFRAVLSQIRHQLVILLITHQIFWFGRLLEDDDDYDHHHNQNQNNHNQNNYNRNDNNNNNNRKL